MAKKWFPEAMMPCPHCGRVVVLVQRRELHKTKQDKWAARKKKKEESDEESVV